MGGRKKGKGALSTPRSHCEGDQPIMKQGSLEEGWKLLTIHCRDAFEKYSQTVLSLSLGHQFQFSS